MKAFRVTYEVVTQESAEDCDAAERGFVDENGTRWQVWPVDELADSPAPAMSLAQAARILGGERSCSEDSGSWFTQYGETDYRTGAETSLCLHPPRNVTAASYNRLVRYFIG